MGRERKVSDCCQFGPRANRRRPLVLFAGVLSALFVTVAPLVLSNAWGVGSSGGRLIADVTAPAPADYSSGLHLAADPLGGYWTVSSGGVVTPHGGAPTVGSLSGRSLDKPVFGMAPTPSGHGYWLVASDGGVFSFGDAAFYGSTGSIRLNQPIVGVAPTPSGHGYWLVASDGGVFSFGDAAFYGSTGSIRLNQSIVGMAPTPSGHGYWLVASDGGVFSFGDAAFYGSTGSIRLNNPIVAWLTPRAATVTGWWLPTAESSLSETQGSTVRAAVRGG